jgi:hypothetical protein
VPDGFLSVEPEGVILAEELIHPGGKILCDRETPIDGKTALE